MRKHNVSCEMHIFPNGRHGLGLAATEVPHVAQWAGLLQNWLTYWLAVKRKYSAPLHLRRLRVRCYSMHGFVFGIVRA